MNCKTLLTNSESSPSAVKRFVRRRFVARRNHNKCDHEEGCALLLA